MFRDYLRVYIKWQDFLPYFLHKTVTLNLDGAVSPTMTVARLRDTWLQKRLESQGGTGELHEHKLGSLWY